MFVSVSNRRWTIEQVAAVAPSPRSMSAAESAALPSSWNGLGADESALWGRCRGSGAEPYDTMVDHVGVAWRCTCPSRKLPCKHALALLVLWVRGQVPEASTPARVAAWIDRRVGHPSAGRTGSDGGAAESGIAHDERSGGVGGSESGDVDGTTEGSPDRGDLDGARDERVARMLAGLTELERWIDDRLRTGLADPSLAQYATWDSLAARLVDARAGALANRVRRLAGLVGASPGWHDDVLSELGMLHLIACAGQRVSELPGDLADAVAVASGWQIHQADVLAGVPETDDWTVIGRSDVREDRIEVRRVWLRGSASQAMAMVLSFAAYRQSLDTSLTVGTVVRADLHRFPGSALRALLGERFGGPEEVSAEVAAGLAASVADACDAIGRRVAVEPWLDRFPATLIAAPALLHRRWVLSDTTGSIPLIGTPTQLATLLAASAGEPVLLTVEWSPRGVQPLAVFMADRVLDIGPRADASFVGAA